MRTAPALIGAALAVALTACGVTALTSSGISVPAGPQLDQFGLTAKCQGEDSSCTDRAMEIAEGMLQRLGPPLPPAPAPAAGAELVVPFTIQVDRDPPWEWRSTGSGTDGSSGTVGMATIDVEPFLPGEATRSCGLTATIPRIRCPATSPNSWSTPCSSRV